MGTQNNSDLSNELRDVLKINQLVDGIPQNFQDIVIPVVDVNPKHSRRCDICRCVTATNFTSVNLLTIDPNKEFFLTNATLSYIKDVTSVATVIQISAVIEGVVSQILRLPSLTLTAGTGQIGMSFPIPVRIDRGTTMTIESDSAVANLKAVATLQGFTVLNTRA